MPPPRNQTLNRSKSNQLPWCCYSNSTNQQDCANQQNLSVVVKHFTFAVSWVFSLLPCSQTSICQWLPQFYLRSRGLPNSAQTHITSLLNIAIWTYSIHLKLNKHVQENFPFYHALCPPPKPSLLWVNNIIHLPNCSSYKTRCHLCLLFPSAYLGHHQAQSALL